jgi:hypothetical protein
MTKARTEGTHQSEPAPTKSDLIEQKLVALAEQLGMLVATVQTKAEGWLDRPALTKEIGRIRDSAADLLADVNREEPSQPKAPAPPMTPAETHSSRGPVDAPGKRHRKPLPKERVEKQVREPKRKHLGQRSFKTGRRGGRG